MKDSVRIPRSGAYLIVVSDVVVGQDLAQAICEDHPQAEIVVATSLDEAVGALGAVPFVGVAFIAAEPEKLERSRLYRVLSAQGAQVVLMGLWTDQAPKAAGWKLLPFPFTTDNVRGLLATR